MEALSDLPADAVAGGDGRVLHCAADTAAAAVEHRGRGA